MRKGDLNISYRIYANAAELDKSDADLMLAAEKSLGNAYARYSGFKVGAALLLENGEIILGNNQEKYSISFIYVCRKSCVILL